MLWDHPHNSGGPRWAKGSCTSSTPHGVPAFAIMRRPHGLQRGLPTPWTATRVARSRPRAGGAQHPLWRHHASNRPPHRLRDVAGSRVPPPGGSVHCKPPGRRGAGGKERAPTRKSIHSLRVWLGRHDSVLVPLLWAPMPRWQAVDKDQVPNAILAYPAKTVIGGRVAKTTKEETVYHTGYAVKVTTAMKDAMEPENRASELRVCCHPRRNAALLRVGTRRGQHKHTERKSARPWPKRPWVPSGHKNETQRCQWAGHQHAEQ